MPETIKNAALRSISNTSRRCPAKALTTLHTMNRESYYRELLRSRRQQLLQRRSRAAPRPTLAVGDSQEDGGSGRRMDRLARQLFLDRVEREDALELEQIADALQRIDSGRYGHCAACGASVSEGRLQLLPHTAVCSHCASAICSIQQEMSDEAFH